MQTVSFLVSFFSGLSPYKIWIRPLSLKCVTSQIGHLITLSCNVPGSALTVYEWTKEGQVLSNDSRGGVLNVTISSSEDFGVYTYHGVLNVTISSSEDIAMISSYHGVLNVTISSSEDFGVYTYHAFSSDGVTSYNISVCQSTADVEKASEGIPACQRILK